MHRMLVHDKTPEIIRAEINQRLARRIRIGGRSTTEALATNNCAPIARLTPRFCSDILKHRTQLAISEATADLERKRDQKQRELDGLKPIGDLIPLARTIADLIRLRWEVSDADAESFIRMFFVIFIHTILLSTSWLCFSSQASQNTASMKPASVEILPRSETQSPKLTLSLPKVPDGRDIAEHFLKTRLKASKADHLDLKPTHDRYCDDCEAASCQPIALNIFSRMLAEHQLHTKKTRGSKTGGTRFWGVTITDGQ